MYHLDRRKTARGQAVVTLLAITSFTLAGGGLGFWLASSAHFPAIAEHITPADPPFAPLPTHSPRSATTLPPDEIDTIAARLGEVQAELLRLNALGARLVEMSGLDPAEFDFDQPPPQGGPEGATVRDYTIKELVNELGSVVDLVRDRQRKLDLIEDVVIDRELASRAAPDGWPVRAGYISSRYGFRVHPTRRGRHFHTGIDFASPRGTPILVVADGVVTFSGRRSGYGRLVDIRHKSGLVTRYAHNSENLVREGQVVRKGDKIATVGSSGTATGPHVHFEVLKGGHTVDPMRYLDTSPRPTLAGNAFDRPG